jgi:3',5'-cyclic AMP phosphodiesterase CpdA
MKTYFLLAALLLPATIWAADAADVFVEKPYLQLGDAPKPTNPESLMLLWHAAAAESGWKVELRTAKDRDWRATPSTSQKIDAPGIPVHFVYRAQLTGLPPGQEFRYRVSKAGAVVFESTAKARKSAAQPYRFALFGDCAQGTPSQKLIADQVQLAQPDFTFITGDIVYTAGRISEYRTKYFPFYASLIQSIPFIAAPGNHDTALANFQRFPDALAYFFYWDQPLNGPVPPADAPKSRHVLMGSEEARPAFFEAAAKRYPVMANFSFDYGNAHWTVLDSNPYIDWSTPALVEWVKNDLEAARGAKWRFVAFHHPGFNSSKSHFTDQWMRGLAPVFEAGKVDIVWSGHVHNYQRSFPLTFAPKPQPDGARVGPKGEMAGEWVLDKQFGDGASGRPKGVIYIVSGAGGAGLYNPEQQADPNTWQAFTNKYIADQHSFTQVDVKGGTLEVKQISETGKELDSFRLTK